MTSLYIGTMSGTSMDGVDAILIDFAETVPRIQGHHHKSIPDELRARLRHVAQPQAGVSLAEFAALDAAVGRLIGQAVNELLETTNTLAAAVQAIGSHGQTIFHEPQAPASTSLQIGNPNVIAQLTGVTTVADFRRRDIAEGGQGAPLVPAFHHSVFASTAESRVVLNLGGIANITSLPPSSDKVIGFDTGPGNCFLDLWSQRRRNQKYDAGGSWARGGTVNSQLLASMLSDPYFDQPPPKSTGREYFHSQWLTRHLSQAKDSDQNIQATLTELTAASVAAAVQRWAPQATSLYVCGGGAYNDFLLERLHALIKMPSVTTAALGIEPHLVEAAAFAWLAKQTLEKKPGNLPSVTGAACPAILGGVYFA